VPVVERHFEDGLDPALPNVGHRRMDDLSRLLIDGAKLHSSKTIAHGYACLVNLGRELVPGLSLDEDGWNTGILLSNAASPQRSIAHAVSQRFFTSIHETR